MSRSGHVLPLMSICVMSLATVQVRSEGVDDSVTKSIALVELYDTYCSSVAMLVKEELAATALNMGITLAQLQDAEMEYLPTIKRAGTEAFCTATRLALIAPLEDRAKHGSGR